VLLVSVALGLSGGLPRARAQFFEPSGQAPSPEGNIEGLTVVGKGSAAARPNRLEIELEVAASSELSADAIVKYRDAKKRLQDAFAGLKLDNVAIEERGLLVDEKGMDVNPYFFDYTPNRRTRAEVQLTRKLVVKCAEIRKLDEEAMLQLVAKLLDVAQDAGGKVVGGQGSFNYFYYRYEQSTQGLVRFILDDYDRLEEEAYDKAMADARRRAERLAKLSDVKLGPVVAVRVVRDSADRESAQGDDEAKGKGLRASRFQEIPVKVDLMVRFEVAAPGRGAAGEGGR
jgi:uncharacterized protein YggE